MALPTGLILKDAQRFLTSAGFAPSESLPETRKLAVPSKCGRLEFLLVKPVDAPLYVEQGVADIGVSGKDVLMELAPDLLEPLDLIHFSNGVPEQASAADLSATKPSVSDVNVASSGDQPIGSHV